MKTNGTKEDITSETNKLFVNKKCNRYIAERSKLSITAPDMKQENHVRQSDCEMARLLLLEQLQKPNKGTVVVITGVNECTGKYQLKYKVYAIIRTGHFCVRHILHLCLVLMLCNRGQSSQSKHNKKNNKQNKSKQYNNYKRMRVRYLIIKCT